jgi:uncharacterized protein (DUF2132 family)
MARTRQDCPLEGKSLAIVILLLVEEYGWKELSDLTRISTFKKHPNFITSINYLKKTPSARKKVEDLYLRTIEGRPQTKPPNFGAICAVGF